MEPATPPSARRTEDIALDLLKFIASHASIGRSATQSTPGFAPPSSPRPDDQVNMLIELYVRCREAVEAPARR
jgi:hypothetical protein